MSFAHEGGQRGHASGAAVAARAAEVSPVQRAEQASTVADNLARWTTAFDDAHRDLTAASTPDAHAAARDRADQALGSLRDLAARAPTFIESATDPATRDLLRCANTVVLRAEAQAQTRPPPPAATAASASSGHAAFLAALPPAHGRRRQESPALIAKLMNVIESHLAFSDLDPLAAVLVDDDAARTRFERLSERARQQIVARLTSRTLRQRLLAEHNAQRRSTIAPPSARTLSVAPEAPDTTREVATQLGAQLGVTPRIATGEPARAATEARGADGIAHHDEIAIHPDVDPASAHGRRVIAHELVHQAQARLPADHDTGRDDAEAEADALAAVAATGGELRAPTHAIDLSRPAGNNDARTDAPDAAAARSNDHALTRSPGARHDVFAATGKPYLIEARTGKPGAWVVRSWITAHGTRQGDGWIAPACARELLTAMGWIDPARIEFAASTLSFRFSRAIDYLAIGAEAAHSTGLRPGTKAIVERAPVQALTLTVALDDPSTPPGTPHELTASEMTRAIDAAAGFTQLTPTLDGLGFVMTMAAREPVVTGNGTFFFTMNRAFCRTLFGFDAFETWWSGKLPTEKAPTPDAPKLALTNFYQRPVPGELTHYAGIIESGERTRFEVLVEWPPDAPNPEIYDAPPMVTPSKFGNVAILTCAWRFERITPPPAAGGAPATGGAPARGPDFLRALLDQAFAPGTSSADATPAAAAPIDAAPSAKAASGATTTEIAEAFHAFKLAPGEAQATWRVTCDATCDAYFTPNTFSLDVTVQSSKAAMTGLRTEAFAGLGTDDRDRDGARWKTPLAADHVATPTAPTGGSIFTEPLGHDAASASRRVQREQLQNVRAYLATADEQNPGADQNTATLAAIDRELDRQWKTEAALANDRQNGAQPFQLRGTYLSRTEGLASGPLELHGTVRTSVSTVHPTDTDVTIIDSYGVQIRDLSRRFAQEDFLFVGQGRSFATALEDAFNDLATAYPKGLVAIEAEELRSEALRRHDGSPGAPGPLGTGQAIGFQRSSETTWKQVKDAVWNPVTSMVVNLGAMAIMSVAPFTAPVIAPALIVYNAVPVVDNLATHANRGTLTPRELVLSVGELALNVLPMVGSARPLGAGWYAIETANWGGQALILNERVKDLALQLQTQQVAALARQYAQLLDLKQRHSADNTATARAEAALEDQVRQVNLAIHDAFTELAGQNLLYAVAATTIHSTLPGARAALLAALERRGTTLAAAGAGDPPGGPATDALPPSEPRASGHGSASTTARDTVTESGLSTSSEPGLAAAARGSAEILPPNRYKLAPDQNLSGSVEKQLLVDSQTGKKYLFKPNRADSRLPTRATTAGITPDAIAQRAKAAEIVARGLDVPSPEIRLVQYRDDFGSLQEMHHGDHTYALQELENKEPELYKKVTASPEYQRHRSSLDAFDHIINNLDRNQGNLLVTLDEADHVTQILAIDHDLTFTRTAERFTDDLGIWARGLPKKYNRVFIDKLRTLTASPEALRAALGAHIGPDEISAALARAREVLADVDQKRLAVGDAGTFFDTAPAQPSSADARVPEALTQPSLATDPNSAPAGRRTPVPSPGDDAIENIDALNAENASATALARAGYRIEQNPAAANGSRKRPDYKIEGQYFDNYAPTNDKARNIWFVVKGKVESEQARRIVLNLDNSRVDMAMLAKQFADWPITELEQVLVVRGGTVSQLYP